MERMQVALEKARVQRQTLSGAGAPADADDTQQAPSYEYTQTKVIKVPEATLRANGIVAARRNDAVADIFGVLRTQVLQRLTSQGHRTVAICSTVPNEGKTLTAINLAVSISLNSNHSVLLVDADFRRPTLHRYFGIQPDCGLEDHLTGSAPLSNCLINPGLVRLVMLPCARPQTGSSEILSSRRMAAFVHDVRSRYQERIVVFDLPPVLSSDDCLVFLPLVEACLLVVREGVAARGEIQRAAELLRNHNLLGTVYNDSSSKPGKWYY